VGSREMEYSIAYLSRNTRFDLTIVTTALLLLFWLHTRVDLCPRLRRPRFFWLRFRSKYLPVAPPVAQSPPPTLQLPSVYAERGLSHQH